MTLEEFYVDLSATSTNSYVDVGKEMLLFVELVNQTFAETLLWGLTSHARLVIQNADNWKADWFVIISNIGTKEYYFEYLVPENKQPWPNATVRGEARTLADAKKYLLIAMRESGGWKENTELKRLLEENNL
ncbi:MAG: hypothetical protein EOO44_09580 [Flavobacterium sp.]|nr:MAG: hypothetical protein EOO44_09580 [Flavobacterium sp.]